MDGRKEGCPEDLQGREEVAVNPAPCLNSDTPPIAPHIPRQGEGSQSQSHLSEIKAGPFPQKQGEGRARAASGIQARQQEDFPPAGCGKARGGLFERSPAQPSAWGRAPSWCPHGTQFFPEEDPLRLGCVLSLEELRSASGQRHTPSLTLKNICWHIKAVIA